MNVSVITLHQGIPGMINGTLVDERAYVCVAPGYIYFVTIKWALGLVCGVAPVTPESGPFDPHFSVANGHELMLTLGEDICVQVLMFLGSASREPRTQPLLPLVAYLPACCCLHLSCSRSCCA